MVLPQEDGSASFSSAAVAELRDREQEAAVAGQARDDAVGAAIFAPIAIGSAGPSVPKPAGEM